jgi:hypothetical protein
VWRRPPPRGSRAATAGAIAIEPRRSTTPPTRRRSRRGPGRADWPVKAAQAATSPGWSASARLREAAEACAAVIMLSLLLLPPAITATTTAAGAAAAGMPSDEGRRLSFSGPVLIQAIPGKEQDADGFGAIDVDPIGESTVLYGAGYWTSFDSGAHWVQRPPTPLIPPGMAQLPPDTASYGGQDGGFHWGGDGKVHNLGAIGHCPPNGCWTNNHTRSSCLNVSSWVPSRNQAWLGCNTTPPPATCKQQSGQPSTCNISQQWLTSSPSVGYVYRNSTDGKLWSSAVCKGVTFRGLPQALNQTWGMCDGFTSVSRLKLADGSVLATFPLVFAGEHPPLNQYNHSLIVNHLPMSLVVFRSADDGFTFDFLAVACNYSQIPGMPAGRSNPYHLTHSAYGPQENGMALLSDNRTIMITFRPDTDSMCPGGPVPYKFYHQVYSTNGGKSWSPPTPIHGVGCVRPRMVRLPSGPLLMTGGRLCPSLVPNSSFAGHGCLPQGGNGQGGIFVWMNADGMADAPRGTQKGGSEWQTFCLGAIHNAHVREHQLPDKYLFTNLSRGAGPDGQSQTYNSLVPLGDRAAAVFYQLGYGGLTASTWMMRIDVT